MVKTVWLILAALSTVVASQPDFQCREWFKMTHINAKSRECFEKCSVVAGSQVLGPFCGNACDDLCQPDIKVWLYFGNGMLTTKEAARNALFALNEKLYPFLKKKYPSTLRFLVRSSQADLAYNTNLPAALQLLEVLEQKGHAQVSDFFYWLSGFKTAPEWFKKKMSEVGSNLRFARMVDSDLKKQVDGYLAHLTAGDGVIVVAHSQGNLYRDEAFHVLSELSGRPIHERFGSVSVATPSGSASTGTVPMGSRWYTTLFSDPVIGLLPTALSPNTRNQPSGYFDHYWTTYLEGGHSRPKILEDTAYVLSQLNGVFISPSTRSYDDGCNPDED